MGAKTGAKTPRLGSGVLLSDFILTSPRPLPVIVLADVSGSMAVNGKIDALNDAVSEMIATFAEEEDTRAVIHVSVITFGEDGAKVIGAAHGA